MHITVEDHGLPIHLEKTGFENLQNYGSCEFFKKKGQKSTSTIGTFIMRKSAKMNDLKKIFFDFCKTHVPFERADKNKKN